MRRALISGFLLLAACEREPSFDERYEEAEAEIEARAQALERELAAPDAGPERDTADGDGPRSAPSGEAAR